MIYQNKFIENASQNSEKQSDEQQCWMDRILASLVRSEKMMIAPWLKLNEFDTDCIENETEDEGMRMRGMRMMGMRMTR